jgi:CheY-like chemotaxis protein
MGYRIASVTNGTPEARLLVVEDEPNIRELLATSLRFAGFEVHVAADGATALKQASESPASSAKPGEFCRLCSSLRETPSRTRSRG